MTIRAAVFDLFGTLLDITSLAAFVEPLVGQKHAESLVARWREKQLAYAFASSLMERYVDFDVLTAAALDYALATLDSNLDPTMRARLCGGWLELSAYPDAIEALEALRSRGVRTAVLTNGTAATAKRALAHAGLDAYLDYVWSVDEVRRYKPSPQVYAIATSRLRLEAEQIAFVSSNSWDASGAASFGLHVVWCNRRAAPAEQFGPPPAHVVSTLVQLADLLS